MPSLSTTAAIARLVIRSLISPSFETQLDITLKRLIRVIYSFTNDTCYQNSLYTFLLCYLSTWDVAVQIYNKQYCTRRQIEIIKECQSVLTSWLWAGGGGLAVDSESGWTVGWDEETTVTDELVTVWIAAADELTIVAEFEFCLSTLKGA